MNRLALRSLLSVFVFVLARTACGLDVGMLPLNPDEAWPQLGQRGLEQIESIPTRIVPCPVCGYEVEMLDADKLMRRPVGGGEPPPWTMHTESRDADLCPHPGKGRISVQADITVCPSCGFAGKAADYRTGVPAVVATWVRDTLRPNIRQVQAALLGARAKNMSERQIVDFFNRQRDIPDTVRTEHYRVYLQAVNAPALARAEGAWLAAWAARREHSGKPRGAFLAQHDGDISDALQKERDRRPERDEEQSLVFLLGRTSSGNDRLPHYGDILAARLRLAGRQARKGLFQTAERTLREMAGAAAQRFLRADQDPFWPHTSSRASRTARLAELETIRRNVEAEIVSRLDLMQEERAHLAQATECLRQAVLGGELDDDPKRALFHAYLMGEFLRRSGDFPLASEWLKNLIPLAEPNTPIRQAAENQLQILTEQAGKSINLLAALGQDGEVFAKLRAIVAAPAAAEQAR